MPIHDWTRVPAALFHDFHQSWSIRIEDALNAGRLPEGLSALVKRRDGLVALDILSDRQAYAARANRIVVRRRLGRTVAVIEIASPGNKDSRAALRDFVDGTVDCLRSGIHVLVVDVFPPTPRDPFGLHKAIWDEIEEELDFEVPEGKDRTIASYEMGAVCTAYVEPVGVGDVLPTMPLFLAKGLHVPVPLEPTYQAAWDAGPEALRRAVATGLLPDLDAE